MICKKGGKKTQKKNKTFLPVRTMSVAGVNKALVLSAILSSPEGNVNAPESGARRIKMDDGYLIVFGVIAVFGTILGWLFWRDCR